MWVICPMKFGSTQVRHRVKTDSRYQPAPKSRLQRQLTYFHDGTDPILIASNHGGPKHPQRYYNLKAHPDCQFGDEKFGATEVTDPGEYARLYGLAEDVYAGYSDYRAKTAPIGRHIPMFRLTPR